MARVVVKKWGNSLGIVLPRELVKEKGIHRNEVIDIQVRKEGIRKLFGSVKFSKTAQEIKDDLRKGWKY